MVFAWLAYWSVNQCKVINDSENNHDFAWKSSEFTKLVFPHYLFNIAIRVWIFDEISHNLTGRLHV